jgi:hypothetical protein
LWFNSVGILGFPLSTATDRGAHGVGIVEPLELDLNRIPDEATRQAVQRLLHLVEQLHAQNQALRADQERLRDEIRRLKREPDRPSFPPKRPPSSAAPPETDLSSEKERREPTPRKKAPKLNRIALDRRAILRVDPALLPPDAQFKGYEPVVIQDLVLRTDNVLFLQEVYHSASQRRSYQAELPEGYTGQFGPHIRSLALVLAHLGQMSEPQIHTLFTDAGIAISRGTVSGFLIAGHEGFHAEAQAVLVAGMASSPWQHLDVTPTRVDGENEACHILGNPLYTAYQTRPHQDRLTVIGVLQGNAPRRYRLDEMAWSYLEEAGVAQKVRRQLAAVAEARAPEGEWDEATFGEMLDTGLPGLGPQQRQRIWEAGALAAYWAQEAIAPVHTLVCDDAPQFRSLTPGIMLCWVHDGRHYKKLMPYLPQHRVMVEEFRERYWEYYRQLRAYRRAPTAEEAARLEAEFDELFSTRTGLAMLDERIALTRAKKTDLLRVLPHPELPLNNNAAELGARRRVRKRDVSFGPRTAAGKQAWDTFQTLAATAAKLGVSFGHYLHDRVSGARNMVSLAQRIAEQAPLLNLGQSWATP